MTTLPHSIQWILGGLLIFSSLGVILAYKPVHASLSFLMTLLLIATMYLELGAQFIAAMQILVYAGAILVIFMFVIILFQDAHSQIARFSSKSSSTLLLFSAALFLIGLVVFGTQLAGISSFFKGLPEDFGTVQTIGRALYVDFFFPFEVVVLIFLIAIIGALYIGKKER